MGTAEVEVSVTTSSLRTHSHLSVLKYPITTQLLTVSPLPDTTTVRSRAPPRVLRGGCRRHAPRDQGCRDLCYVVLKDGQVPSDDMTKELKAIVRKEIGPIATPDAIQFSEGLPKTRSGKIMRRILRKLAENPAMAMAELGDISTLADPGIVALLKDGAMKLAGK